MYHASLRDFPSPFQNGKKANKRFRILELHALNDKCHWCGCKTVISPSPKPMNWKEPNNLATIDHLYSKYDIRRPLTTFLEHSVLSCRSCNAKRSHKELLSVQSLKKDGKFSLISLLTK